MNKPDAEANFAFRWKYVMLPLVMLLLSVILVAVFYNRLPFPVAYHFSADGSPDRFAIPGLFVFWALAAQVLLALGAVSVNWLITQLGSRFLDARYAVVSPQRILLLTGNMVALPQIILLYWLLDVFLFNTSQKHLGLPVLAFALIVMVLGGSILGIFFIQSIKQVLIANKK
ncbi:MAG: DUF1648 domain-containing protein [Chloroflexi bacterium]|nr:DUF1648 domain-containing protein [Chloroflexota bacterium]